VNHARSAMRIEHYHCLLLIFIIAIVHTQVSGSPGTRVSITNGGDANCTRVGDVLVCPCNITINGIYYPCWLPINNGTTNNTCTECPIGRFSSNTTANCTEVCPIGTCLEPYKCEYCPPGHFSNKTGSTSCMSCPAGYATREPGSHNCTACPAGFTSGEGAANCAGCDPGSFSVKPGSPYCELCDFGYYSPGKSETCYKCPKGTYNDKRGQGYSGCSGCGAGFYGPSTGLTSKDQCNVCPAGSYCPDLVTALPQECPRNYYCLPGSSVAKKCSLLYESKTGKEVCTPGVGFYIVIFGSIGAAGIFFVVVWRWRAMKQDRLRQEYRQTEIDRLIPKPRDGPVYTGF